MASKPTDPYKQALYTGIASLIRDAGYGSVEPIAMESLVEMAHSLISQVGKSSKHYSELANRSQVMVSDLSLALIHSGLSLEGLKVYTENHLRKPAVVKPPQFEAESTKPRSLAVNSSTSQPGYMHENLPSFPDKHTYIQTPAQRHATTDYQLVRQKESMQRKNLESALTKFIAKTGESNFYCDDIDNPINSTFQLIACNPSPLSYLSALLPKDEEEFEVFDLSMEQELFEPAAKKAKQDNSDSSVAAENSLMS